MTEKQVLKIKTIPELKKLTWQDFADRDLTQAEFEHIFSLCDAFWMHDGNPKRPHAILTTGRCTNGFIDTLRALRFTNICLILAHQTARLIQQEYSKPVDWVVGSDHAAATFSFAVASFLNAQHDFTEKADTDTEKKQLWKRFSINPDEPVLQVEELVTSSATLTAVRNALREGNPNGVTFVPFLFTLVHRSDVTEVDGSPLRYLFHFDIWSADPETCKLCKQGSSRLKAKKNWAELTGKVSKV